jgi:mono/diheme cytochrome c family protein
MRPDEHSNGAFKLKKHHAIGVGLTACALVSAMLFAQAASSTRDGAYTTEQAAQGQAIFKSQCVVCHDPSTPSDGQIPALTGDAFLKEWAGQSVGDLYSKLQATMPNTSPGSLKPDQVTQLIAYILSLNNYPAGKTPLPSDQKSLQAIHFDMP